MAERTILIRGDGIYREFINDLSHVMDHSYDIDEIFVHYRDWTRRGEMFVDEFVLPMYPPTFIPSPNGSSKVMVENEDHIALRNAMINLYCALDRAMPGLDRRRVCHTAYSEIDDVIIVVTQ
ncbi:hypothetical protein D3C85_14260 [compost metagenome]